MGKPGGELWLNLQRDVSSVAQTSRGDTRWRQFSEEIPLATSGWILRGPVTTRSSRGIPSMTPFERVAYVMYGSVDGFVCVSSARGSTSGSNSLPCRTNRCEL